MRATILEAHRVTAISPISLLCNPLPQLGRFGENF